MDILRHVVLIPVTWLMAALEVDASLGFEDLCRLGHVYLEEEQVPDIFQFFEAEGKTALVGLHAPCLSKRHAKACFLAGLWVEHLTARKKEQTMHANSGGVSEEEGYPESGRTSGSAGEEGSDEPEEVCIEADSRDVESGP